MDTATKEFLTMLFVIPTFLGLLAWCFRLFLNFLFRRRVVKNHFEIQNKMLDKFSAAPDLLEVLAKNSGIPDVQMTFEERVQPHTRILRAVQVGAVFCTVSIAFLVLSGATANWEPFIILGVLGFGLGIGFLLAAWGAFALSRKWGLLEQPKSSSTSE